MAKEVRLPKLGQTMEEGTIVGCLVKVGDEVKKGDIIFEVETDKATLEMQSPADGFVKNILANIGQALLVGDAIMVLGDKDEQVPQSFIDSLKTGAPVEQAQTVSAPAAAQEVKQEMPQAEPAGRAKASPRAKMLAEELGVNLEKVVGTGPAGKITEEDVRNAAASKPAKKGPSVDTEHKLGQTIPLNRMQKVIAQRMLKSKLEIPCFYLTVKADMTKLVDYRTERNKTAEVKIAYNDFLVKAVATGLENFPIMTGQLNGDNIQLPASVGVGLAISVPGGLVAPIVKDAHKKNIIEIAKYTQGLIEKARNNKLSPDDMDGGCITVSSLGAFGIDSFIPIVVPGQCSIMGIGQIADTCVPNGGNVVIRKLMAMTLSVDHKVANGAYAAQFLDYVRKILEDPTNFE